MQNPQTIIIGAGIVGAITAFRLAKAGILVLVLEENAPGSGVTAHSSGWVNWICGDPIARPETYPLLQASFAHFAKLDADLHGALKLRPVGALRWLETQVETEAMIAAHRAAGSKVEAVEGVRLRTMLTKLNDVPPLAAYCRDDLAIDARAVAIRLLDYAKAYGAKLRLGHGVEEIRTRNGQIIGVADGQDFLPANAVVIAAGTGSNPLLAPFGLTDPVASSPAARIRLAAQSLWPGATELPIIAGPGLEVQFRSADQIFMAKSVPASLIDRPDAAARIGARAKARLEEAFPGLRGVRLLATTIGARPYPKDTNPLLGPVPGVDGLYTAIGHPGVILAPMMAQTIADMIVQRSHPDRQT